MLRGSKNSENSWEQSCQLRYTKTRGYTRAIPYWQMGASDIANRLKKRDPATFSQISRNTIEGWVDRSGVKPRWKESVLRQVEDGNNPGHSSGGHRGILVRVRPLCKPESRFDNHIPSLGILMLSKQSRH